MYVARIFVVCSACKNPKSSAYSGRIAAFGCPLLLASAALCTLSLVNLPWIIPKSPQWLVRFHITLKLLVGLSTILVPVIIPLNVSTGAPIIVPSSGSKKALYTNTSLLWYDFSDESFISPIGPFNSSEATCKVIDVPLDCALSLWSIVANTNWVLLFFMPVILKCLPLFVPPETNILSPSLNPSCTKSIPDVVGTLKTVDAILISELVTLKFKDSAASSSVIPDALASTVSE